MEVMQCAYCAHFLGGERCAAFREGIPEEIYRGEFDHRRPYPGDDGVRWQPASEGAAEIAALTATAGRLDEEAEPGAE